MECARSNPGGRLLLLEGKGWKETESYYGRLPGTAIVRRLLDVPVINLGFSGSGKMEPEMVDLLTESDPAVYVFDCLWNMQPAEISERVGPFVRKLREVRPSTPILLVEDSTASNTTPTEEGTILRRIYRDLKAEGVRDLHFLSNGSSGRRRAASAAPARRRVGLRELILDGRTQGDTAARGEDRPHSRNQILSLMDFRFGGLGER